MLKLSISIVVYHSPAEILAATLTDLSLAVAGAARSCAGQGQQLYCQLLLVHNDGEEAKARCEAALLAQGADLQALGFDRLEQFCPPTNLGYGLGHNLAIEQVDSELHLILNPDACLQADALSVAIDYLGQHPGVGLVAPAVFNPAGQREFLCKAYPSVLALFLRGFVPPALRRCFRAYLADYEMQAMQLAPQPCQDVAIASGCCMLVRTALLRQVGGFSPQYFLYFEDFDLSLRLRRLTRLAYLPAMRLVHHGGYSAAKGAWHIGQFCRSALTFFRQHGWRWI